MTAALLALGCESESPPPTNIDVEATSVIAGVEPPPIEGGDCGQARPGSLTHPRFTIRELDENRAEIIDDIGGCELTVAVTGETYRVENARCRLADGAPLRVLGVVSRTYDLFVLDLAKGTYEARSTSLQVMGNAERLSCAVAQGRIVEAR